MGALYDAQWCRIVLECGAVYLAAVFLVSFLWEEGFKRWWEVLRIALEALLG